MPPRSFASLNRVFGSPFCAASSASSAFPWQNNLRSCLVALFTSAALLLRRPLYISLLSRAEVSIFLLRSFFSVIRNHVLSVIYSSPCLLAWPRTLSAVSCIAVFHEFHSVSKSFDGMGGSFFPRVSLNSSQVCWHFIFCTSERRGCFVRNSFFSLILTRAATRQWSQVSQSNIGGSE